MKVVIPGGSGQIGAILARAFGDAGDEVVVLSRSPRDVPWRVVEWDGHTPGPWMGEIEGADVVINLAGRSVDCRYTPENRRQIMDSRRLSTAVIGKAIADAARPPGVWLQMSTATIYSHRYDAPNDEANGLMDWIGSGIPRKWNFSENVAKVWESIAVMTHQPPTRLVLMRSAMVMSPDRGGVFDTLLRLVRLGLGGTSGDGRQFVSWIHDEDFVRAVRFLIEREDLSGPVNLASPNPLPNREFMEALRRAWGGWGQLIGLPATKLMLEIGAFFMRTESELILKSRRVVPGKLMEAGFTFEHPEWPEAAVDLCRRVRDR